MRAGDQRHFEGTGEMCAYCFAALGTLVGGTALAKAGGLLGLKAVAGVVGAKLLMLFR